ncbi:MAG TPA: NlpC/P60 family protein [Campylobacterales bacterium]|nr:NlpC/P60 family protein [Campylobacterales bacterium]HHS92920.1 NlpC/P60 family protein [Campylobacterales bacterium]
MLKKLTICIILLFMFLSQSQAHDFDYYENIFIEEIAKTHLGTKYVWGGNGQKGYDCSGFTKDVFEQYGVEIPRNSWKQAKVGQKVSRKNLRKGDLIFFNSAKQKRINHVGIYLGNGKFIHASSFHKKIVISPLKEYKRFFQWGRRLT